MNEVIKKILGNSKSYREADFLHTIFGRFHQDAISGNMPVVLYGAGSAGKELYPTLKLHGVHPGCFCDNDTSRIGNLYCGIPVISFDELEKVHKDSLIVVTTSNYSQEITKQLLDNGFWADRRLSIDHERLFYYAQFFQLHSTLNTKCICGTLPVILQKQFFLRQYD